METSTINTAVGKARRVLAVAEALDAAGANVTSLTVGFFGDVDAHIQETDDAAAIAARLGLVLDHVIDRAPKTPLDVYRGDYGDGRVDLVHPRPQCVQVAS